MFVKGNCLRDDLVSVSGLDNRPLAHQAIGLKYTMSSV
jgi:hypothetical protein